MVKLSTSVITGSLLVVPALALSSTHYERNVAESDLYGRDFADLDDIILTREDLNDIFGREFVSELEERSPIRIGGLVRGAKSLLKFGKSKHAHSAEHEHEHGHSGGHFRHAQTAVDNFQSNTQQQPADPSQQRREFDEDDIFERDFVYDIEERSPIRLGGIVHGAKSLLRFGKSAKHGEHEHGHFAQHSHSAEHERFAQHGHSSFGGSGHSRHAQSTIENVNSNPQPDAQPAADPSQQRREFDEALYERYFGEEDLFTREYFDDLD